MTLLSAGSLVMAQQDQSENREGDVSLDQAVLQVKQQTGGRILSAKTKNKSDSVVHKIKVLLPNGKVRIIRVNAK